MSSYSTTAYEYTSEARVYEPAKVSGARYAIVPAAACVLVREVAAAVEVPLTPIAIPKSDTLAVRRRAPVASREKRSTLALLMSWCSSGLGVREWQWARALATS